MLYNTLKNIVLKLAFIALSYPLFTVHAQPVSDSTTQSADYSSGMSAYMNNDFESAQRFWLTAAQANDGRAMFNLGLLHERQKVANASAAAAEQWFQRAGAAGYAPADYHLALRLQARGQNDEAQSLLQRAADAGFLLARERLGLEVVSSPVNRPTVSAADKPADKVIARAPASKQSQNRNNTYYRENWVLGQSPEAWTIQLLAFSDEAKVRNFIDDHALHRNAAYFEEGNGGATIYKLIYGAYPSKQAADKARAGFTSALKEHGPWLRPLRAVQAIINGG